jgi:nitrate reductase alpha subunit
MDFVRGVYPKEALGIGRKEFALQMAELLAKRINLTITDPSSHPNNPEIIFSWKSSKDGSYMNLIEKGSEYSVTLGLFNYGNESIEDIVAALKKDVWTLSEVSNLNNPLA